MYGIDHTTCPRPLRFPQPRPRLIRTVTLRSATCWSALLRFLRRALNILNRRKLEKESIFNYKQSRTSVLLLFRQITRIIPLYSSKDRSKLLSNFNVYIVLSVAALICTDLRRKRSAGTRHQFRLFITGSYNVYIQVSQRKQTSHQKCFISKIM